MIKWILLLSYLGEMVEAAMNLPPETAEDLVTKMRSRIFVETKNLFKKNLEEICSSLSGPSCHFGRKSENRGKSLGRETFIGGVIPDNYVPDSPGFDALAAAMPFDVWKFDPSDLPELLLPPPPETESEGKMLDLKEQAVGRRVPSGFSQGLPDGVVASWQGRWLVDDRYRAEKGTSLPTYIRFSKPVLPRNIWIELDTTADRTVNVMGKQTKEKIKGKQSQQAAIVLLRRGTETVWSSRMLMGSTTVDVLSHGFYGHAPLSPIDEIVVLSRGAGVRVVAIELDQPGQVMVPLMLLTKMPVPNGGVILKHVMVDSGLLRKHQLTSLQDAITDGYELDFGNKTDGPLTIAETVLGDESKSIITTHLLKLVAANDDVPLELRRELEGRKDEVEELANRVLRRVVTGDDLYASSDKVREEEGVTTESNDDPDEEMRDVKVEKYERNKKLQTVEDLLVAALMHM
ncbi:hypothetical protein FOL47_007890 [Perkinsus chesapeaki]|uniref:Uncharacterized protein n=1 Tax=Perkinsus chesapeaki TaxID=330153 RepID=A0A7J6LHL6_PERCH|nr:hypothetical protein FOL47_007890 [Perkinsus chesapeaki]